MKKLLVLVLVLCLSGLFAGCTPVDSAAEHGRRYVQITDWNAKMLVDDWDYIWLYERSSKLTQWHPHVGY